MQMKGYPNKLYSGNDILVLQKVIAWLLEITCNGKTKFSLWTIGLPIPPHATFPLTTWICQCLFSPDHQTERSLIFLGFGHLLMKSDLQTALFY